MEVVFSQKLDDIGKKPLFLQRFLILDGQVVYIGSANLTGAGIGMKGDGTRNFEAGILTDNPELVEQVMSQFDDVWIGKHCKSWKPSMKGNTPTPN